MGGSHSNLLVVSDLHLGGPLRAPIGFRALRQVVRLDLELCRFLDYHRRHPLRDAHGERVPWTLVLNGDTIDFLHFDMRPDELDEDEAAHGLDFNEERSRWKVQRIACYHRRAIEGLARFVDAGNSIVFVVGNHDADLYFGGVRADLQEAIARAARDPAKARDAVGFRPWFYFEERRVYIEHGHRFDPYATFPDPLSPLTPGRKRLAPTFGHWALRFFCNRVPEFPVHDVDRWEFGDFMRWASSRKPVRLLAAAVSFFFFLGRYVLDAVRDRLARGDLTRRAKRKERLRRFAAFHRMPLARIRALDALRLPHVADTASRLAQALFIDRLALALVVGVGIYGCNQIESDTLSVFATLVVLGAGGGAWWWLARSRPAMDIHPLLGAVARRIARLTGARVVVFGHTHVPVLERAGAHAHWLNPGSWEHLPRQQLHAAEEPCDCHARFALITGEAQATRARLMRWCRRQRAPLRA